MKIKLIILLAVVLMAVSGYTMPAPAYVEGDDGDPINFVTGVYYDSDSRFGSQTGLALPLGKGFYTIPKIGAANSDIKAELDIAWITPIIWKLYGGLIESPASAEMLNDPDVTYITNVSGAILGISFNERVSFGVAGNYYMPYDTDGNLKPKWTVATFITLDL